MFYRMIEMGGGCYEIPEAILILGSTICSIYGDKSELAVLSLAFGHPPTAPRNEISTFVTTYGIYSAQNLNSGFLPHRLQPASGQVRSSVSAVYQ